MSNKPVGRPVGYIKPNKLSARDINKAKHIRHKAKTNPELYGFNEEDLQVIASNASTHKLMNTVLWMHTTTSGIKINALRRDKLMY